MRIDESGRKHYDIRDKAGDKQGEIIVEPDNSGMLIRLDRFAEDLSSTHRNVLLASTGGNITLTGTNPDGSDENIVIGFNVMRAVPVADYDEVATAALAETKAKMSALRGGAAKQRRVG